RDARRIGAWLDFQLFRPDQRLPVALDDCTLPHVSNLSDRGLSRVPSTTQPTPLMGIGPLPPAACRVPPYTRRRLRGRQPLCGIGVVSRLAEIETPTACSARGALSRPEPGPLTSISSISMPCSRALRPASSAATCAAYGVDLRLPLKPWLPADDQAIALPCASVMVTTVLLNVAATCATPDVMFLRSFLRGRVEVAVLAMLKDSCCWSGYGPGRTTSF